MAYVSFFKAFSFFKYITVPLKEIFIKAAGSRLPAFLPTATAWVNERIAPKVWESNF